MMLCKWVESPFSSSSQIFNSVPCSIQYFATSNLSWYFTTSNLYSLEANSRKVHPYLLQILISAILFNQLFLIQILALFFICCNYHFSHRNYLVLLINPEQFNSLNLKNIFLKDSYFDIDQSIIHLAFVPFSTWPKGCIGQKFANNHIN